MSDLPDIFTGLPSGRPLLMGILNVTPDSFSDGGRFMTHEKALQQARLMAGAGADILDVGGESTRPGASAVGEQEEMDRVIPVIQALADEGYRLSVDTSKTKVMREAISAGAGMINDVCALRSPGSVDIVAATGVAVCLMHMQGEPRSMQENPHYEDVCAEVEKFLLQRVDHCIQGGISRGAIILDPGIGFGKNLAHNLSLIKHIGHLKTLGFPVLLGASRKSLFAKLLDEPVEQRLAGSLAVAAYAFEQRVDIVRVHDVKETKQIFEVLTAIHAAQ